MMEQFEKWFNDFDCDTIDCHGIGCDTLCKEIRAETWQAALRWIKNKLKCEIQSGDIEYFVDKELGDI